MLLSKYGGDAVDFIAVYRVVTFVPVEHLEAVKQAVLGADPLEYGNYQAVCWTSVPGIEQFVPNEKACPSSGKTDEFSHVRSVRFEFSIPLRHESLRDVLAAIQKAHPWEEPVIYVTEVMETRSCL